MAVESVGDHLFSEEDSNVFAVLDGASVPDLRGRLERHQPEHYCLYRGELKPDVAEAAPYLVSLTPGSEFTEWAVKRGWGKHWGIFAVTREGIQAMRRHFRTFLIVHDTEGKPLYFRYYDPRVLRTFLPTCNTEELKVIFGPVTYYLLEDENPNTALRFRLSRGSLQREDVRLT